MGNPIKDLRLSRSLPAQEIVDFVRTMHPKFDKPLLSKCESTEAYGVEMAKGAKKALLQKYGQPEKKRKDNRRCPHRLYCRLDDETYTRFIEKCNADGFKTINDCLVDLIRAYTVRSDWDV